MFFLIPDPRDKSRGNSLNYYIMNCCGINCVAAHKLLVNELPRPLGRG